MTALAPHLAWLAALPRALRGDVVVDVIDRGAGTAMRFAGAGDTGSPAVAPTHKLTGVIDEHEVEVTLAAAAGDTAEVTRLWEGLLAMAAEREKLQRDLEGMYPTSLALLEEAAMWGDVLPSLPTGSTEEEVAEIGVRALVVAASVERALFVRWRPEVGQCEVLVHMVADRAGSNPRAAAPPEPATFTPGSGLVGQALRGSGAARLARVTELANVDGPERLALKELIAVPVRYGVGEKTHTLGVLLVMDKCANSYTAHTDLSSHETKLAHAVAAMLGSVLGTRRVAELGKELETAQEIHRQIQGGSSVKVPGFTVAGHNRACGTVGGDYFDFVRMADGRTFATVMDVSGHNLASGMLMVSARTSLRLLADLHADPGKIVTELARAMHGDLMRTERFISVVGAALAPGARRIDVVNAGHLDTLVLRAQDQRVDSFASDETVLGVKPGIIYQARAIDLQPGDLVLLYTDGVIETCDHDDEMFGMERLADTLRAHGHLPVHELLAAVVQAVDRFRGATPANDDVTLLAIRVDREGGTS